jgi:adenylosuccinate synthase
LFPANEFQFARFNGREPFTLDVAAVVESYWKAGTALKTRIGDIREVILKSLREKKTVVAEFGQAYWLDKRHGFSPNVTASHTYTPEVFLSANIPLQPIHTVGVAKAYDTKVGTHVFVTQMDHAHPLAAILKKLEFGATTGRQRMVGWFDAVEKGDALRYCGYQDLMINKIDALSHQGEWSGNLLICYAYEDADGNRHYHVPRSDVVHKNLKPLYREYAGWSEDISHVRSFAGLPKNAQVYVGAMVRSILESAYHGEKFPETLPNLRYLGVGPEPSQIIKDIPATSELIKLA